MTRFSLTVAFASLLVAPTALAQHAEHQAQQQGHGEHATPQGPQAAQGPHHADDYTTRVRAGIDQLQAGNTDQALSTFREALSLSATRPEAQYYIGEAQRVSGHLDDALSAFQQAATLAEGVNEPRWQARALAGAASTLERMDGRIEDARTAWQAYVQFATGHTQVSDPAIGQARLQAIDMMNEQEHVYVEVRQRIADREQERAREQHDNAQHHHDHGH